MGAKKSVVVTGGNNMGCADQPEAYVDRRTLLRLLLSSFLASLGLPRRLVRLLAPPLVAGRCARRWAADSHAPVLRHATSLEEVGLKPVSPLVASVGGTHQALGKEAGC